MTRVRSISILSLALAAPLAAQRSADTAATRDTVYLTPIAVTATRSPQDVFLTPVPVNVLDRADLRGRAPNGVADLFRGQVGLDVSGVGFNQIRPVIRGQRGQRILVLADGQRLNNSRRQQDFGEIPSLVDVATVERVEVVRGPASVLYGSDAIGGVVNIITRAPQVAGLHGNFGGGYSAADQQTRLSGALAGRYGAWSMQVEGAVRSANGYDAPAGSFGNITLNERTRVADTGGDAWSLGAYLGYEFANGHDAYVRYERYDADTTGFGYVDPAAYAPGTPLIRITYPFQTFDKLSAGYRARGLHTAIADQVEVVGYAQGNDRGLDLDIAIPTGPGSQIDIAQRNQTDLSTLGLRAEAKKRIGAAARLTYGIDVVRDRSRNRDSSTTTFVNMGPIPPSVNTTPLVPFATYRSVGGFAQGDVAVAERLALILGARYQNVRAATESTPGMTGPGLVSTDAALVGAASAVYRVAPAVSLVATVGRAFRSPNLVERFFDGPTPEGAGFQVSNPALRPETSLNVDLGVRLRTERVYAEGFVFQNDIRDGIRIAATGDSVSGIPEYRNVNVDRLRFRGVELSGHLRGLAGFSLAASFTHLDSENVLDPSNPVGESFSTSYRAALRWDDPRDRVFAEYELRGNGDRKDVLPGTNPVGATLPAFTVHNVRAGVTLFRRGLHTQRIGVAVLNLTDVLYAEFTNVSFFRPEARRSVAVTYDVTF
ncbi:MAG: TonB-dependent receptor [Gemmatimonadota bacterium]|nr:TonB-dependent receptor [Gemmatimonadota bacterium]